MEAKFLNFPIPIDELCLKCRPCFLLTKAYKEVEGEKLFPCFNCNCSKVIEYILNKAVKGLNKVKVTKYRTFINGKCKPIYKVKLLENPFNRDTIFRINTARVKYFSNFVGIMKSNKILWLCWSG